MIPAVHPRGRNVGRLLQYLFGPGKKEEHTDPRLVAAWLDAPAVADLEPPTAGNGQRDVRLLTELLEQPVAAARNAPAKTVWHCSIRNHPTDRILTDAQWAHIAGEAMAAIGLAPHGDTRAVRWVAVRHAPDHIHLVATLVRQDRRTAWAWKDKLRSQQACRELEERYGLYRVAPPGSGSRKWPNANEINKAARLRSGQNRSARATTPREVLRQRVREAAALATDEDDFFARLRQADVLVKPRYSTRQPDQVTGYAVGLREHATAGGATVWYGGGRLGPDLTLPRLRTRWATYPPPQSRGGAAARLAATDAYPIPPGVYQRAADAVGHAAEAMRAATDPRTVSAIASAAADLLTAAARTWEGDRRGPLTDAAETLDRAAHEPQHRPAAPPPRVSHAAQLRSMARLIGLMGALSRDRDTMAALHLLYTLAALAESLADLRDAQQRRHQAQAARHAARRLRTVELAPETRASKTAPKPGGRYRTGEVKPAVADRYGWKR